MVNQRHIGHTRWVMHFLHLALLVVHQVTYVWHSGDNVHIKLTVQTLLDNLHVEQTQEAAAETKAQRH